MYLYDDGDLDHSLITGYADFMTEVGDPRAEFSASLRASGSPFRIFRDYDFIDTSGMRYHPYYQEMLRPLGLKHAIVTTGIKDDGEVAAGISLQRTGRQGPASAEVERQLHSASFHFRQALAINEHASSLTLQERQQISPVQLSPRASLIDKNRALLQLSASLERQLLSPGVLTVRGNALAARSATLHQALDKAAHKASFGSLQKLEFSNRRIRILIVPIFDHAHLFLPTNLLALFVEPIEPQPSPREALRAVYGLTTSESEVVYELYDGSSLKEIAEHRSVSIWTVRTQLKSVFRKMEVKSQREVLARTANLATSQPS